MNWLTAFKILSIVGIITIISMIYIRNSNLNIGDCLKNDKENIILKVYDIKETEIFCEICSPRKCMFKTISMSEFINHTYNKVNCEE